MYFTNAKNIKMDEAKEVFKFRCQYIQDMAADFQKTFFVQPSTIEMGQFWPIKDPLAYGIVQDLETSHNINSFAQIGWTDPFPRPVCTGEFVEEPDITDSIATQHIDMAVKKNKDILAKNFLYQDKTVLGKKKKEVKLIYPLIRYDPDDSPMTIYIPTRSVMFKLMRACLGCKHVEDLWIFHEDHTQLNE
jgi:hypothetical protein